MFGCHNCKKRPLPGTPYEQTECARCRAARDPFVRTIGHELENLVPDRHILLDEDPQDPGNNYDEDEIWSALGRALLELIRMQNRNPGTFRVIEAKIADPYASYAQLAEKLCCRKQNIFYHLRRAAEICPELATALQIGRIGCPQRKRQE